MDLGRDVVVAPDGFLRIAEAIKASWAGKLEIATKELYREGGKKDGVLARVPGESMASYVSRRRRWYRSLTTLDKTFSIPEHLQLEMMMMDCAGITDHQHQLARLAATKLLTLETMSLALVQEYPLIHEKELSRARERPHLVRRPFPHRPSNRFQPVRSSVSRAYWSYADEESEDVSFGRMSTTLMTTKMTCRTMQRTGVNHAVRMENVVTWWIAWNKTLCVHSWQLTALSAMRTCAKTFRSVLTQNVPLSSDLNRHVSTVCMWKKSCTASDQNQNWKSRNVESLSSMRREIRHAEHVDERAIGQVIKFGQISLEVDQHLTARRAHGTPIWSRDVLKTDKRHMKGKDQPKGAGKHTSFRTRAPFNREARIAQAMNDEAGKCTGRYFQVCSLCSLE